MITVRGKPNRWGYVVSRWERKTCPACKGTGCSHVSPFKLTRQAEELARKRRKEGRSRKK